MTEPRKLELLDALSYSTHQPRPKKSRTKTKPKALPQGMNAASDASVPIPGMTNQNT